MNGSRRTSMALACVVGLLLIAVVARQAGVFASSGDGADDAPSPRTIYLARAALAAQESNLVAAADQWKSAADHAGEVWADARRRMISARSVELAGAQFRDAALDALAQLDVVSPSASMVPVPAPKTTSDLHVETIQLEMQFDVRRHTDVYAAIDRLEHLPGVRTHIKSLRIDGPGRMQMPRLATVRLRLVALTAIEGATTREAAGGLP